MPSLPIARNNSIEVKVLFSNSNISEICYHDFQKNILLQSEVQAMLIRSYQGYIT